VAALGDSGGLWGQAAEAWLLGNMRRPVEILGKLEVPYWYGHALLGLGAFLNMRDVYEEATSLLSSAVPLEPAALERLMHEGAACASDEVLRRARGWLEDPAAD
jgi:hypothetical protein